MTFFSTPVITCQNLWSSSQNGGRHYVALFSHVQSDSAMTKAGLPFFYIYKMRAEQMIDVS